MIYLVLAAIAIYLFRVAFMYVGAAKIRSRNSKLDYNFLPRVSVIVPARNEEDNIGNCLESISQSDYPSDLLEIIAINDRSSDSTLSIMEKLSLKYKNIKIVNLTEPRTEKNMQGKPGALHNGIQQASGDIVLMTDADCIVHKEWVRTSVRSYADERLGLQASFTLIAGNKLFDKIQALEWIFMHTMASAGMALNQPLGCYGNNLSIRKSVYDELGGYPNIPFSLTEDLALEKAVFSAGYKINYLTEFNATVTTRPCVSFKEYLQQHKRWAIGGIALGWRAVVFVLTSLSMWIALFVSVFTMNPLWLFALLFTRIAGDYAVLAPSAFVLKQNHILPFTIPSVLFFMFIELIIPFTLLSKKVVWKGQTFKSNVS